MVFEQYYKEACSILVLLVLIFKYHGCVSDVTYEGKKYVMEGSFFEISCIKSSYGIPKWTRNGQAVDPLDPEYEMSGEKLDHNSLKLDLRVKNAFWKHRGEYKCDPFTSKFHDIEIVPSIETDVKMRMEPKVLLKPSKTLKLVCDQEENAVFPINWYKDGKRILVSESDPRVKFDGRALWNARSTDNDAGDYMCVVEVAGLSHPFAEHLGSSIKVTYPARVTRLPLIMRPIQNRNLSIECEVQGFPIPRVSWLVDDIPLYEFMLNDTRYSVTDNSEGLPESVFMIEDVQFGDDHYITCRADNVEGTAETRVRLQVRESAIVTNEAEQGKGLILSVGEDLVLQCNNTDSLESQTEWLKNGQTLSSNDTRIRKELHSLIIEKAVDSDCGNYTCKVAGQEATIAVKSNVRLTPVDSSRNVVQNQKIVLLCNVTQGTPAPTLQWLKDDHPLNMSNPRISIKTDARGIEGTELVIADAQFEDRAEYTCVATNEVNSVNVTILVRVKDKYAALWPFLGICAEVAVLCTIIFIYEKRRSKPDFDESEAEQNTENKAVADQEDKGQEVRQRK